MFLLRAHRGNLDAAFSSKAFRSGEPGLTRSLLSLPFVHPALSYMSKQNI
jgi:hypothetical protein